MAEGAILQINVVCRELVQHRGNRKMHCDTLESDYDQIKAFLCMTNLKTATCSANTSQCCVFSVWERQQWWEQLKTWRNNYTCVSLKGIKTSPRLYSANSQLAPGLSVWSSYCQQTSVMSTLQLWWRIQERRGYQWLLINLTLCLLTKKQRNKVEFQCSSL